MGLDCSGRSLNPPGRVRGLEDQQVQQPLVLREFRAGKVHAAIPGRAEAARVHHGPLQGELVKRGRKDCGAIGSLFPNVDFFVISFYAVLDTDNCF